MRNLEAILPFLVQPLLLNSLAFFQAASVCRAPVCQPCRHRAQGFQAGNGTHQDTGSFLTWLTPWRKAHSTACLIIAFEQTNTCRLQVMALVDFYRKWLLWNHLLSVWHEGYILSAEEKKTRKKDQLTSKYSRDGHKLQKCCNELQKHGSLAW